MERSFKIEPLVDGRWALIAWPTNANVGVFETPEDAKQAADNLSRETIYYAPHPTQGNKVRRLSDV